ncbi:MAG TPA: hypothetical protein VI977_01960 [archaeon]|nr:hypothetical protein [archaeon]
MKQDIDFSFSVVGSDKLPGRGGQREIDSVTLRLIDEIKKNAGNKFVEIRFKDAKAVYAASGRLKNANRKYVHFKRLYRRGSSLWIEL